MLALLKYKICFFIIFPIFLLSIPAQDIRILNNQDRILLEDFENFKLSNLSVQMSANTHYLPQVRLSKNLTSPDLQSKTSLLIRIDSGQTGIPFDLKFTNPYTLEGYIVDFEFNIYSNNANGDLFLYFQDGKFQKHKLKVGSLNFDGWKTFKIPIGNLVFQSDFIIGKSTQYKLTGLQINVTKKETNQKEDIIVLDDIFWTSRKKYQFPLKGMDEFH